MILLPQVSLAQGIKDAFGAKSPLAEVKKGTGYSDEDIGTISGRVINTALTIVGVVFLLLMVYAGYLWMTAQGEDAQVKKATDIIKGTVIGLVLVLSAYAITIFVTKGLNPAAPAPVASCQDTPEPIFSSIGCIIGDCNGLDATVCANAPCCDWVQP